MNNKIMGCLLLMAATVTAAASGTSSPYSQYGLGVIADQSQGGNRAMNGVGIALRHGQQVNTLNPASYAVVDSMTMLFDMGLSGQITNYKEGGTRVNSKNGNFEYAVGAFRAAKGVGVSFGLLPLTNVGYDYSTTQTLPEMNLAIPVSYTGSGGLHQAYVGAGWQILPQLAIGANISYLWGSMTRSVVSSASSAIYNVSKVFSSSVSNYKLDLGAQWVQRLGRKDVATVGAIVGIGHKLGADAEMTAVTSSGDGETQTIGNALKLPMSYGVGVAVCHANSLTLAVDGQLQQWGKLQFPQENSAGRYVMADGLMKDRMKLTAGVEWLPSTNNVGMSGRKFFKRIRYRAGVGYATPYYYINGQEGPKELSASAGFGILLSGWLSRSVLNLSGQWTRTSATGLITENTYRLNIGITFNERWFAKWKVE